MESQAQQRQARPGMGGPPTARFDKTMQKLFGENSAFTADMHMEMKNGENSMSFPGKLAFLEGKSRFEMDTTKMRGGGIPPQAAEQMKQMGMAEIINISRPDKKENYMVYPGLKAYAVVTEQSSGAQQDSPAKEPDIQRTEIGKETVEGHACTKYKVVIKDDTDKEHQSTIWAAKDLNNFPIKMETVNSGVPVTITYKNVRLEKPDEALFTPPADFKRYNDMGAMMQEAMMKRFSAPPGGLPQK
jgi:hypothetical protein